MTTRRDLDRSISTWLDAQAPSRAPDDVLEASRDRIRTTRQRRAWLPAWRSNRMNIYAKLAAGAAAVLVVAVVGYQLLPGLVGPGGPTTAPSGTATPEPTPVALPEDGPMEAGRYRIESGPTFIVTVPTGWVSTGMGVRKHLDEPDEVLLDVWTSDVRVFRDACESEGTEQPIGPTAADLLTALRDQENSEIADVVDMTIAGLPGIRVGIAAPAGLDLTTCSIGDLQIWVAADPDRGGGWLAGIPQTVYIVDTPSGRLLFNPGHEPAATAADIAELYAIVASIEIVE